MRGINWKLAVGFFVFAAALYAAGMVMFGEPILLSVLMGVLWAAFFVPVIVWLGVKTNEGMIARRRAAAGSRTRREPELDEDESEVSRTDGTPSVIGRRDGGGFYRRTVLAAEVEPSVAAAHLETDTSWRVVASDAAGALTLRRGSRAWLRLVGAWEWGPKSRDHWPFLAHLARHTETGPLEVTVEDNFGRWLNLHSSNKSALSHVAAYGDELLDDIEDSLQTLGRSG
ncbi:hypothetical protein [Serinicoccus marinus]|uniref:hypothetical protein n=1 Tax=Serinicoccus marinus TaxID=247333 RepID=UPI00249339E2|nr:hypothetical protein [Serinicoccus marinus]